MNSVLWIIFYVFAVLSFIPVIKLEEVKSNKTHRRLWFLSLAIFMWTLIIAFKFVVEEPFVVYYLQLLTYPIVALITYLLYETFQHYTKRKTSDYFHFVFITFIVSNLLISLTNPFHQLMIQLPLTSSTTIQSFSDASYGIFFYIHAFISYLVLMVGFIKLLVFVKQDRKKNVSAFPFQLVLYSIIFGIGINVVNIFFYSFVLDPTYIFLVIITYILYTYIYRKDYNFNLFTTSKDFILDHMREMYLVLDHRDRIVEYSRNLKERYKIDFNDKESFDDFLVKLKEKAVIFTNIQLIKDIAINDSKSYLHMTSQEFKVGTFSQNGKLISLFDETQDVKHLAEIEQLRTHDLMTNLYNRNYFEEHRMAYEKAYKQLGIIMIDVDGLKLYNDYLGHKAGDMLIQRFGKMINQVIEKYIDVKAMRMGGDEFVIIIPKATQEIANQMISEIEKLATHKDIRYTINFSYGISIRRNGLDTFTTMMRRADQRMYENKNLKKDYKIKLEEYFKKLEMKK